MRKTTQWTPQFGLVIDWETSGVTWGSDSTVDYQGISLGAVIFNVKTLKPVEMLHVLIKFDGARYKWSSEAEAIHGLTPEFLERNGVTQEEAAEKLLELISRYFIGSKIMLMGHNCEFDLRFTNQLLNAVGVELAKEPSGKFDVVIPLHHVMIDTASVGFIAFGLYKSDLLFDAVGLGERGKHSALEDALLTLETCRRVRLLVDVALNE